MEHRQIIIKEKKELEEKRQKELKDAIDVSLINKDIII